MNKDDFEDMNKDGRDQDGDHPDGDESNDGNDDSHGEDENNDSQKDGDGTSANTRQGEDAGKNVDDDFEDMNKDMNKDGRDQDGGGHADGDESNVGNNDSRGEGEDMNKDMNKDGIDQDGDHADGDESNDGNNDNRGEGENNDSQKDGDGTNADNGQGEDAGQNGDDEFEDRDQDGDHPDGDESNDGSNDSRKDGDDVLKEKKTIIGLKNLGCSCYANVSIQNLFWIPSLSKAIADIPITREGDNQASLLNMQKVLKFMMDPSRENDLIDALKTFLEETGFSSSSEECPLDFWETVFDAYLSKSPDVLPSYCFKMSTITKEVVPVGSERPPRQSIEAPAPAMILSFQTFMQRYDSSVYIYVFYTNSPLSNLIIMFN
jgi:hypothetical protein